MSPPLTPSLRVGNTYMLIHGTSPARMHRCQQWRLSRPRSSAGTPCLDCGWTWAGRGLFSGLALTANRGGDGTWAAARHQTVGNHGPASQGNGRCRGRIKSSIVGGGGNVTFLFSPSFRRFQWGRQSQEPLPQATVRPSIGARGDGEGRDSANPGRVGACAPEELGFLFFWFFFSHARLRPSTSSDVRHIALARHIAAALARGSGNATPPTGPACPD